MLRIGKNCGFICKNMVVVEMQFALRAREACLAGSMDCLLSYMYLFDSPAVSRFKRSENIAIVNT